MKTMILLLSFILVGCTAGYTEQTGEYTNLPPELKDCKIFKLNSSSGGRLYVTKCPHANTSTAPGGKNSQTASLAYTSPEQDKPEQDKPEQPKTVVIDGVEYKR